MHPEDKNILMQLFFSWATNNFREPEKTRQFAHQQMSSLW
jgi:hypothetical protein